MKALPHLILEIANVHGGEKSVIEAIIDSVDALKYADLGIKFQLFSADTISLPDYEWYPVYRKLNLSPSDWNGLIDRAERKIGKVWLDIFDAYGMDILTHNLPWVHGIKLQASVLENREILSTFQALDLSKLVLIINVSGFEISDIQAKLAELLRYGFKDVVLQVGFQAYPTSLKDTGLSKISILKATFPGVRVCIADHASAEDGYSVQVPVLGYVAGCEMVEKHYCLNRADAPYDGFSALEPQQMKAVIEGLEKAQECFLAPFVSVAEANYLKKTVQIPVAKSELVAGGLVSEQDVIYRRTGQAGLSFAEIGETQKRFSVLDKPVLAKAAVSAANFRPARIGVIVACRMKSSRLQKKATVQIGGVASVERCLQNCLLFEDVNQVILATSTNEEDAILSNFTLGGRAALWKGDPEDVISRYLGACEEYGIDVVIRITADCPVVSPEIAQYLLRSHFQNGADYTAPKKFAVGTNCEIINTEALRRVIQLGGAAKHSEYMTWYFQNNPGVFKNNLVELPGDFVRDYRLTLDYPEDLAMFEQLYARLGQDALAATATNVFKVLDAHPEIVAVNAHLQLAYKTDQGLIDMLNKETRLTK